MATGNQRDVNLVIRAKSEADRAFKQSADAAENFGTSVSKLEGQFNKLETTEVRTTKTLRDVAQGLEVQAQKVAATSQTLEQYKMKIAATTAAMEKLKRESVAEGFAGDLTKATAQIKAMEREISSLRTKMAGTEKRPGGLEAQLVKEVEGYRQLRDTQVRLRESQGAVRTAMDQTTEALIRQDNALKALNASARQQQNAAALNARINRTVNQVGGKSAESSAAVFEAGFSTGSPKLINDAATAHLAFEARVKQGALEMRAEAAAARELEAALEGPMLRNAAAAHAAFEARVKQGSAEMRKAEAAAAGEAAEIERLKNVLNPTAAAEARLAAETQKLNQWLKAGKISAAEHGAALKLLKADAERAQQAMQGSGGLDSRGRPSLLGLKPYELQNLSFQINDIFTQLASGTSLTQTLAQQSGQIFQLFPRIGGALVAALGNPIVLAGIAAFATFAIGVKSAADQAERLRDLGGMLAASADGSRTTATALAGVVKELDRYGLSAEEAMAITKQLFRDGLNEDQIVQYGLAAKDLSDVLGIDLKDAVNQVSAAFTGSFAELDKLMQSYDAFTPQQRKQIKDLYEQGDAAKGAAMAMGIFSDKMQEGAEQARGSWSEAFRNLGNAWTDLTENLGNTWWAQGAMSAVNALADALNYLSGSTDNARQTVAERQAAARASSDPISQQFYGSAGRNPDGTRRTDAVAPAPTNAQTNRYETELEQIRKRSVLEGKITSQAELRARLNQIEADEYARLGKTLEKTQADEIVRLKVAGERSKLERELADYTKQQADAAEREAAAQQTMVAQTRRLLVNEEGYKSKSYWDVNAYRVGYGSDTVTRPDGRVERVTASTSGITQDDAIRDLERRIGEFTNVVKGQIGSDRFGSFSASQQAALVSIAYNYGSLPERILAAAKTGTSEELAASVRGLAGDNNGVNAKRRNREADIIGVPNLAVEQTGQEALDKIKKRQDDYNAALATQLEKRRLDTGQLTEQRNLIGEALIDSEKRAAVEDAIAKAVAEATKAGVDTNSPEFQARLEELRKVETAYYDVARAKDVANARREVVDKPVADLTALRDSLQNQIAQYQQTGQTGLANNLQTQLDGVNTQLDAAIAKAREFYASLEPDNNPYGLTKAALDEINLKLQTAQAQSQQFGYFMGISGQQIAQVFASTAVSAIDKFAQAVASGKNAFASLWEAFRQFAADFLRQIAQMIMQQLIFNLVSGIVKSIAGAAVPTGGASMGSASAGLRAHSGGVVGDASTYGANTGIVPVSPTWFTNAARYHGGGIAGLRPDEVPAILQRGEEVLTASDPRHRSNGGIGGGAGAQQIKIVNAIDGGEMMSQALNTKVGEKAILNFMRQNASAVRGALG